MEKDSQRVAHMKCAAVLLNMPDLWKVKLAVGALEGSYCSLYKSGKSVNFRMGVQLIYANTGTPFTSPLSHFTPVCGPTNSQLPHLHRQQSATTLSNVSLLFNVKFKAQCITHSISF